MNLTMITNYIIIITILMLVALAIVRINKKDYKYQINKLIQYLGGKDNIVSVEDNQSRLKVEVKDVGIVNKEAIQKLGARGIVELDHQLKIIYGVRSRELKKYIEELKQI